jgi:hypothetical protein
MSPADVVSGNGSRIGAPGGEKYLDLAQQEPVVVIINVKSDGLAENIFRIGKTDGLGRTPESLRCHSK